MGAKQKAIPKLVATDWDGTFSEQGGSPRIEAIRAKDQLIAAGAQVVLVSGRSVKEVLKYVNEYGLSPEFIAELGSVVYHKEKEFINHGDLRNYIGSPLYKEFVCNLDKENMSAHDAIFHLGIVDRILDQSQSLGAALKIFTPKDGRPGEKGANLMEKKGTVLMRGQIETDSITKLLEKQAPFLAFKDNGLVEDKSGDHAYHLLIKGANKETALALLLKLLKIKKNQSIAFGDSLSDVSLATVVEHFYLMRNGLMHTPDMFERFKKSLQQKLSPREIENVMKRITVTEKDAGLGWAEVVDEMVSTNTS